MLRIGTLFIGALTLTACADQLPPVNFSVPSVGPATQKVDAELRSITVTLARPDEQLGRMDVTLAETSGMGPGSGLGVSSAWRTALEEALNRMVIFRDDAARKVSLQVKVLKLEGPMFGATMTTDTAARYEVINRANGDIIFITDVSASGTTPFDHAFLGAIRARESINRAVQNNIALFLQQLETADFSKPMFPAGSPLPPLPRAVPPEGGKS
jgi:hypothetical protein